MSYDGGAAGRTEADGREVDECSGTREAAFGAVDGEGRIDGREEDGTSGCFGTDDADGTLDWEGICECLGASDSRVCSGTREPLLGAVDAKGLVDGRVEADTFDAAAAACDAIP